MKKVQKRRILLLTVASLTSMIALPAVACSVNSNLQDGTQINTDSIKANAKAESILPSEVTNETIREYVDISADFTFVEIIGHNDELGILEATFSHNGTTVEVKISGFKKLNNNVTTPEVEDQNDDVDNVNMINEYVREALILNDVIKTHPISATNVTLTNIGSYIDFLSGMNEFNRIKNVSNGVKFILEDVKPLVVNEQETPSLVVAYKLSSNEYTSPKFFKYVDGWSSQGDVMHKEFVDSVNSIRIIPKLGAKHIPSTKIKNESDLKQYFLNLPKNNNIYTAKLVSIKYPSFSKIRFTYQFNSVKQPGSLLTKTWDEQLGENLLQELLPEKVVNTNTLVAPRELDVTNINYKPMRFTILYTPKTKKILTERFLVFANSWFNKYKDQLAHLLWVRYDLPKDGWQFSLSTENTDWSQVNGPNADKLWQLHQLDGRLDRFETLVLTLRRFQATISVTAWHTQFSEKVTVTGNTILTGSDDVLS